MIYNGYSLPFFTCGEARGWSSGGSDGYLRFVVFSKRFFVEEIVAGKEASCSRDKEQVWVRLTQRTV
jgi:hypothetical protein